MPRSPWIRAIAIAWAVGLLLWAVGRAQGWFTTPAPHAPIVTISDVPPPPIPTVPSVNLSATKSGEVLPTAQGVPAEHTLQDILGELTADDLSATKSGKVLIRPPPAPLQPIPATKSGILNMGRGTRLEGTELPQTNAEQQSNPPPEPATQK